MSEPENVEEQIAEIIARYSTSEQLLISDAFGDAGLEPLLPRLKQAALDYAHDADSTVSRYAVWANTVRDHIIHALDRLEHGESEQDVRASLIEAANSLSAFSEIQTLFDPVFYHPPDDPDAQ